MPLVKVKLLVPVTLGGSIVDAGEEIVLSERSAASLVADNQAEAIVDQIDATTDVSDDNLDTDTTDTPGEDEGAKDEIDALEELERVRKALDDKYKRDEVAATAKELGVEFHYDAKKAEIIEAVIEAEKAEFMLQL